VLLGQGGRVARSGSMCVCCFPSVHREYVSLEDFELFFNDRKTAAKAFAVFDVDNDNHVTRREVGCSFVVQRGH